MLEKYSEDNPANRLRLSQRFVWSHPAHTIALFFGAGAIYPAPGTWGTLAGALFFVLLSGVIPLWGWLALSAVMFIVGALAADKVAVDIGVADHGSVVIDEVVAIWLVLAVLPHDWLWWLAGFIAFRFFDIIKLWPVSYFDAKFKNGWGVMLDDLFAAGYAWLLLSVLQTWGMPLLV